MMRILNLSGWALCGLMFACGAMGALALAPLMLWPLLLPAYSLWLVYLRRSPSAAQAFRLSWWWGLGFFLCGLYWIAISMTVDLARFGWMIPFALLGLNGALALFPALAGWVFHKSCPGMARIAFLHGGSNEVLVWLLFAMLVFASEWLRGHIFTGFPWNLIGYAWGANDASLQVASLIPLYPLTLLTIALASSGALWPRKWPLVLAAFIVIGATGYGQWRLPKIKKFETAVSMRLVQGNIAQTMKNDPEQRREAFRTHVALSQESHAQLIIWSESALPYPVLAEEGLPPEALNWLRPDQLLITGAVMIDDDGRYSNSIIAINDQAKIIARYDKQHLVPFGEYVPLRRWLPIEKITPGMADFSPGSGPRRLVAGETPFLPLVCYEVIFPPYAAGEPGVLLNLTNDDWFGYSSGPFQHLMAARFRAVEQGRPLIRVANSGITATIDRYGRIVNALPLHERGVIDLRP